MTNSNKTAEAYEARIRQLETELEEMTASLAQAWDQLVPFLQATPQQANSTGDIVPVLESIMVAVDADVGALYLAPGDDRPAEWFTIPSNAVAFSDLQKYLDDCSQLTQPCRARNVRTWTGAPINWLLTPIVVSEQVVGAIGVGLAEGRRDFSAYDARTLMRMTERAAGQIVAADLAASRVREAQIAHAMQIAGLIQRSIQPATGPRIAGLQVGIDWQPAATVGGDAWGWVMQPSGHLACYVLDVAGKGLPAALAAVSLHTALKMVLRLNLPPVDAIETVNHEFYDAYTDAELFATATVIAIDPVTGEIEQANAGHPPTLLGQPEKWQQWEATMPPIGVLPDSAPLPQRATLHPGDMVVCYSDGLSEIETGQRLWGTRGLLDAIPPDVAHVEHLIDAVLTTADRLRNGAPMHDDQTILAIRFGA
ncbi:MAG: serine/threonine-protein phosphatase [Anaerolineae bacterium]|nr:serine/threonine-protein phosphatase [Anaerolineae bacterium]